MKSFGEKGDRVGVSRECPIFFKVPPIISGTGKATNFKFGRYVHRVHPNKSPFKIWEKREHGRIQGLPAFFEYPLLSQEHVNLRTSVFKFGMYVHRVHPSKSPLTIWEKRERGRIQRRSNFLSTSYYLRNG